MSVRFTIVGLDTLRADLRALPPTLAGEGGRIVEAATNAAVGQMKRGYPRRSGELADGLQWDVSRSAFGATGTIRNRSKLAWIFDKGTKARHTGLGVNRGQMPAGRVFVPAMVENRRRMYAQLADLVRRAGLTVTGV